MRNAVNKTGAGSSRGGSGGPTIVETAFWVQRASAADNLWMAVTWIPELDLFVAVAESGAGNRVMTSPDGINWTVRVTPVINVEWWSVAYGAGLIVAVARGFDNGDTKVMTSPDGVTWTERAVPDTSARYRDVCWSEEVGLFVAVGHANKVMRSPDGINWTQGSLLPAGTDHISVCYGAGLFVAVSNFGATYQRVSTSPDGVTWTARTVPAKNAWRGIAYGDTPNGPLFVAVANPSYDHEAPGQLVMTSPDGITWTLRNCDDQWWEDVHWGNGLFVAVSSYDSAGKRAMSSPDGVTWTLEDTPALAWRNVTYSSAPARFVAVGFSGSGNRVMSRETVNVESDSINILRSYALNLDPLFFSFEASPLVLQGFQT